jgi:hypothetical protein
MFETLTEHNFTDYWNSFLFKLKRVTELLTQDAVGNVNIRTTNDGSQLVSIRRPQVRNASTKKFVHLFSQIRQTDDDANRWVECVFRFALSSLKLALPKGLWFTGRFELCSF